MHSVNWCGFFLDFFFPQKCYVFTFKCFCKGMIDREIHFWLLRSFGFFFVFFKNEKLFNVISKFCNIYRMKTTTKKNKFTKIKNQKLCVRCWVIKSYTVLFLSCTSVIHVACLGSQVSVMFVYICMRFEKRQFFCCCFYSLLFAFFFY